MKSVTMSAVKVPTRQEGFFAHMLDNLICSRVPCQINRRFDVPSLSITDDQLHGVGGPCLWCSTDNAFFEDCADISAA